MDIHELVNMLFFLVHNTDKLIETDGIIKLDYIYRTCDANVAQYLNFLFSNSPVSDEMLYRIKNDYLALFALLLSKQYDKLCKDMNVVIRNGYFRRTKTEN